MVRFLTRRKLACSWRAHGFLKLFLYRYLYMYVYVTHARACVYVSLPLRLLITSGVIWAPYDWLNKSYSCYMAIVIAVINGHGLSHRRLSVLQVVRQDQTRRHQWSSRTMYGCHSCSLLTTVGPPLPQLVPPSNMDFLSTILLWQSFLVQGIYRLQYKHPAKALSMVIMQRSYLYELNYLAGLAYNCM